MFYSIVHERFLDIVPGSYYPEGKSGLPVVFEATSVGAQPRISNYPAHSSLNWVRMQKPLHRVYFAEILVCLLPGYDRL